MKYLNILIVFLAGYDVCGLFGSAPADVKSNILAKRAQNILDAAGVLQVMMKPKYIEYATLEVRLESFEKCLVKLKQDVQVLSEAGFFYIGIMLIHVILY